MKKCCLRILLLAALLLGGCAAKPEARPLPDWWNDTWFTMGDILAVVPWEPFRLDESNDALSPAGLYYATWVTGDGREIVNSSGSNATVYDAQIYLLVKECQSEDDAKGEIRDWMDRESSSYETGESFTQVLSDEHFEQAYQVLPLLAAGEENPYQNGAAAFAVRNNLAISVELLGNYDPDSDHAVRALVQFLACILYGE